MPVALLTALPDSVRRMTDVDDGERILREGLEPSGPAYVSQAIPYGRFQVHAAFRRAGVLEPADAHFPFSTTGEE